MGQIEELRKKREKLALDQEKIRLERQKLSAQIRDLEYAALEAEALGKLAAKSGRPGVRLMVAPATVGAEPGKAE